jgi:hypothetical protein
MAEVEIEPAAAAREPTARESAALLEERKRIPALLERVPSRAVVRVVAVVEALSQFWRAMRQFVRVGGGAEGRMEKKVPGFERTSYASFTAAIFCSEPPLSGWAVFAAVRL